MTTGEQRQREIERLTALFTDAILHAPIPDVNPNLIRTVESQARSCALAIVAERDREVERLTSERNIAVNTVKATTPNFDVVAARIQCEQREAADRRAWAAEAKLRDVEAVLDRVEREQAAGDEWDVDEVVHDVRLAVLAESQAPAERLFYVDSWTGAPCPTRGNLLCAITDPEHRHRDGRSAQAPAEQTDWQAWAKAQGYGTQAPAEQEGLQLPPRPTVHDGTGPVDGVTRCCGVRMTDLSPIDRVTMFASQVTCIAPSVRPDTTADDEAVRRG